MVSYCPGLHLIRITQGSILGLLGVPARRGTVSACHQRLRVDSLCIDLLPVAGLDPDQLLGGRSRPWLCSHNHGREGVNHVLGQPTRSMASRTRPPPLPLAANEEHAWQRRDGDEGAGGEQFGEHGNVGMEVVERPGGGDAETAAGQRRRPLPQPPRQHRHRRRPLPATPEH